MAETLEYLSKAGIPASYDYINANNRKLKPGTVHCRNTALVWYFQRYLIQRIISVFEFSGVPEEWDLDYFRYSLFVGGHVEIIKHVKYGVIPQMGTLGGYNVFYRPSYSMIVNPLFRKAIKATLGVDCAIIKMQPDYFGAWDVVTYYADLLALCAEGMGISIINSKFAYVFAADNKAQAEGFKKLFDNIASGQPAQFVDKNMFDEEGKPKWILFTQNLKQNYIANDLCNTMINIEAQFNSMVGIPNVNINKASGVSAEEVNANNTQTMTLAKLWLENIKIGIEQANSFYGLGLGVKLRFDEEVKQDEQRDADDAGAV